jgi:hypothetical protein
MKMSKLDEIKEDYLSGEMFGQQWCSTPKTNFDWLMTQAEKVESLEKERTVNVHELLSFINTLKDDTSKDVLSKVEGYIAAHCYPPLDDM